ncbi:AAA family ATPase [Mycolicibacterium pulveris]|uniref:helix-turn-helix transcriptional regulator n=1 Tax=Mycolicibacterium pulveris TaxID=36813 RepID=UPI003CF192AA
MVLTERAHSLGELTAVADEARAGRGGVVIVCGESGVGKTSFVEAFLKRWPDRERVLWGVCDPLTTPRPLGPIHDLADQFEPLTQQVLRGSDRPYEIFAAVFEELAAQPSVLVIDDMHWADQATVDLIRFVLRRIRRTHSLVVGAVRDDEIAIAHPMRLLLGDVARSTTAVSLKLSPLSLDAVTEFVGDRSVDPVWLHQITGGNAFFVTEMLDHIGEELPTTVRDAILARTVGLDVPAWDLLYLLACAPGPIPDYLLADLGVTITALRTLDDAKLILRSDRGVTFRHDLCRLAIASVIPPGAEADLHRRMIHAYESASRFEPAILTHHAVGAGDHQRIRAVASEAGRVAARSGAHTQAADFYKIALDRGGPSAPRSEAELLELLAEECYLTDRLDDAIAAGRRALRLREQLGDAVAVSAGHHALALFESNNANLAAAHHHAAQAVAALDGHGAAGSEPEYAPLGHALTTQAYLAVLASDLTRAAEFLCQADRFAAMIDDPALAARVALIDGYRGALAGQNGAREKMLSSIRSAGELFEDHTYANGCTSLAFVDIEQRRLNDAAAVLDMGVAPSDERDVPLGRSHLLAMRSRLELLTGSWDDAAVDAEEVVGGPSGPLARTWPYVVRALIALRRDGTRVDGIDEAWRLGYGFGAHIRLCAAAAIAEQAWLTGAADDRLDECRALLASHQGAHHLARGELAMWLHRLGHSVDVDRIEGPYRLLLDGAYEAAGEEFLALSVPYEAALAFTDSGDAVLAGRGLRLLDELGASAVATKIRHDLRARGVTVVSPRRLEPGANPVGLTSRQVEVLRLIGEGLTNAELAERLFLSVKTVGHHVSAILAKMEVSRRRDAVRRGRELGILD